MAAAAIAACGGVDESFPPPHRVFVVSGRRVEGVHEGLRSGTIRGTPMTYNFDPERWYQIHLALLERRRDDGELDEEAFTEALAKLDRDYEAMVARLDGTYQLPKER
jgi:hypothetical protein